MKKMIALLLMIVLCVPVHAETSLYDCNYKYFYNLAFPNFETSGMISAFAETVQDASLLFYSELGYSKEYFNYESAVEYAGEKYVDDICYLLSDIRPSEVYIRENDLYTFAYDLNQRTVQLDNKDAFVFVSTFDDSDRLIKRELFIDNELVSTETRSYSKDRCVTASFLNDVGIGYKYEWTYDNHNQLILFEKYTCEEDNISGVQKVVMFDYKYSDDIVAEITVTSIPELTNDSVTCEYSTDKNIEKIYISDNLYIAYQYGQSAISHSSFVTPSFSEDTDIIPMSGERLNIHKDRTIIDNTEITADSLYDSDLNLITVTTKSINNQTHQNELNVYEYSYDENGRLVCVSNGGEDQVIVTY